MDNKFSNDMASVFNFSREEAERTECDNVSPEHLLLGILRQNVSKATRMMHKVQPDLLSLKRHLEKVAREKKVAVVPDRNSMELNRDATRLMRLSVLEARAQHSEEVDTEHLLKAMLKDHGSPIQQLLEEHGLTRENIYGDVKSGYSQMDEEDAENGEDAFETSGSIENDSPTLTKKKTAKSGTPVLDNFCTDLTAKARKGKLDPVVGREKEMERVAQILSRRKKNNPILIGEPGVGKSAIVEGLAQRIVERKVARQLWGKRILTLDMASMVAGTKFRGQFEERVRNLLLELENNPDVIIYIDEIHTIIGAGGSQGSMDAANMLKPALARRQMQCIGATTIDEFRKTIEKDGALDRRFQKIIVAQSTAEETLQILHRLRPAYEKHHKVEYTDEALDACVRLTQRYVSDRSFPDKAIDAMDESGARMHIFNIPANMEIDNLETELRDIEERKNLAIKSQNYETAADLRDELQMKSEQLEQLQRAWVEEQEQNRTQVTAETVAQVVSIMTGIPAHRIGDEENTRLRQLQKNLQESVVGQDEAVQKVARAIQRSRVGLKDPSRPIGTFLFVGPTGVGKTYLTKRLAVEMFGSETSLIRIDMSEQRLTPRRGGRLREAHRKPDDGCASGLCGLRRGRPTDRACKAQALFHSASGRDRKGTSRCVQHTPAGDGRRKADGRQRYDNRLPQHRHHNDQQLWYPADKGLRHRHRFPEPRHRRGQETADKIHRGEGTEEAVRTGVPEPSGRYCVFRPTLARRYPTHCRHRTETLVASHCRDGLYFGTLGRHHRKDSHRGL